MKEKLNYYTYDKYKSTNTERVLMRICCFYTGLRDVVIIPRLWKRSNKVHANYGLVF